jgi:hypothetical protein
MRKWKPADVIALIVVVTCAVLLMSGIDTVVGYTLLGVVMCYFGIDLSGISNHFNGKGKK